MDLFKTALWFVLLFFSVGKLNCTTANPRFVLYVQSNIKGELNCFNTQNSKFETIEPEVNLPNIKYLTIPSCQLLKTPLIHQLINDLGIERLNAFTIVRLEFNFKNNNEMALSWFRFNWFDLENFALDEFQYAHKLNYSSVVDVTEATIPIELLQNRNQLQALRLSVELTNLSENMLSNLTNLKELYLKNNKLHVIHLEVVENLANLETIDLSHNNIKILNMRQFPNLQQLKYVNLSSNEIDHIYFRAFHDNRNLQVVDLQNNPISGLPPDLFAQFPKLVEVNLRNCTLRNLPSSLFYKSESLKSIDLSSNEIAFIRETVFDSLKDLRHLDLSSNKLKKLPNDALNNLKNLKHLNLSNNNLIKLENFEMRSLSSLEEFDLSYNYLDSILIDLRFAKNLSFINLSHNRLNELMLHSPSLKKIDLSHNKLTKINQNNFLSENLTHLDASFNEIDSLDIDFFVAESPLLATLNLSINRISSFQFFSMRHLTKPQHLVIDLDKNAIKCDCQLTRHPKVLQEALNPITAKYVTVKGDNWVCESPENLKNQLVQNLNPETLKCPNFYVKSCPKFCNCYVREWDDDIIVVDCENANLTEIPTLNFPHASSLEVNLQNNFLRYGPQDSMGYERVTQLLLSHNNITDLTWTPPGLKTLTLDHNNFTVFDSNISELLNSSYLLNVTLGDNPWVCNCSTKIFQKYLSMYKDSKSIDVENIICTGSKMIDLKFEGLCELSYTDIIFAHLDKIASYLYITTIFIVILILFILLSLQTISDCGGCSKTDTFSVDVVLL